MKYFLDTEFLEGPQKEKFPISLFRKQTPSTIDLISIGIVEEDSDSFSKRQGLSDRTLGGKEYYAISKDFNLDEAWNRFQLEQQSGDMRNIFPEGKKIYWIRENVLRPIYNELNTREWNDYIKARRLGFYVKTPTHSFTCKNTKRLIKRYGKTNKQIVEDIISFTTKAKFEENESGNLNIGTDLSNEVIKGNIIWDKPEFYAYFADYDWVGFCWLFGKMIDLPDSFPMYCKDLKQILDETQEKRFGTSIYNGKLANNIKELPNYPKQNNAHNALDDTMWNKKLFEFLNKI